LIRRAIVNSVPAQQAAAAGVWCDAVMSILHGTAHVSTLLHCCTCSSFQRYCDQLLLAADIVDQPQQPAAAPLQQADR
jgi:hypothetical protein